jgi:hypothetical protein
MATKEAVLAPPKFVPDEKPTLRLPEGRTLGVVVGLALDSRKHIWVLHLGIEQVIGGPLSAESAARLPPVCEFDAAGNFLRGWGGPNHLPAIDGRQQWPKNEETISIDDEDMIWLFGSNKEYDHAVQRFTPDGKLLLRIGEYGVPGGDDSCTHLGCPTDAYHDVARREVYVTDGYVNHRVVVFDSDCGAFIRAWGGYGKPPSADAPDGFNNPVHAITRGPDDLLYVSDRKNDRLQVFDALGRDAPIFIREIGIDRESPFGTVFNIAFEPSGDHFFISDGSNSRIWTVDRAAWKVVDSFEGPGSFAGDLTATIHKIITDKDGNLLLGRCQNGVERMNRIAG